MRRHILGIISLALILIGGAGSYQANMQSHALSPMAGYCIRAGLLLGALWLALPQIQQLLQRFPPWMLASMGIAVLVLIVSNKLILAFGIILLAIVALKFLGRFLKPAAKSPKAKSRTSASD